MNKDIIEAGDLPQDERIYMKKDFLGWRVVYPIKNPNGSINWFNLITGGKRNLIFTLIMIAFVLGFFWVYNHDTAEMQKVVKAPCSYCPTLDMRIVLEDRLAGRQTARIPEINFTQIREAAGGNNETQN